MFHAVIIIDRVYTGTVIENKNHEILQMYRI